jgi:hypothetical protein
MAVGRTTESDHVRARPAAQSVRTRRTPRAVAGLLAVSGSAVTPPRWPPVEVCGDSLNRGAADAAERFGLIDDALYRMVRRGPPTRLQPRWHQARQRPRRRSLYVSVTPRIAPLQQPQPSADRGNRRGERGPRSARRANARPGQLGHDRAAVADSQHPPDGRVTTHAGRSDQPRVAVQSVSASADRADRWRPPWRHRHLWSRQTPRR